MMYRLKSGKLQERLNRLGLAPWQFRHRTGVDEATLKRAMLGQKIFDYTAEKIAQGVQLPLEELTFKKYPRYELDGDKILPALGKLNITQIELSRRVGLCESAMHRIINYGQTVDKATLKKISAELSIPIKQLVIRER